MSKSGSCWLGLPFLAAALMLLLPAEAKDAPPFILAKRSIGPAPLDPLAPDWSRLKPIAVSLYPQTSVAPRTVLPRVTRMNVRALYNAETVALHLEWPDINPARARGIGTFADAAAVQWPVRYGPGMPLPYVGMGHAGAPVALWFWRADGSSETLAAEGFGTLTRQPSDGVAARGVWKDGVWRLVFRRTLGGPAGEHRVRFDPRAQGVVPLAFAVWNGEAGERNGGKRLSPWILLRFEKARVEAAYVRTLTDSPLKGNATNGRRLMTERGCINCHSFPGNPERPSIGPDLTYVGAIHSARYLSESLRDPSHVIVPGKSHTTVDDGKRASVMPPFAGTERELVDVVAFLKTLH